MLWIVIGGVGSGKSAFAEQWARKHGREAVKLACPAWPDLPSAAESPGSIAESPGGAAAAAASDAPARPEMEQAARPAAADRRSAFAAGEEAPKWITVPADQALAERLNRINLRSNPFRASGRVIVVDSLSGWLRQEVAEAQRLFPRPEAAVPPRRGRRKKPSETDEIFRKRTAKLEEALREVVAAVLGFEGRRIVVTEETPAGLLGDPWERWYVRELAEANRRLVAASDGVYRMTAGIATEIAGMKRKRGTVDDENLYPNRG